jgi:hypothetical protein
VPISVIEVQDDPFHKSEVELVAPGEPVAPPVRTDAVELPNIFADLVPTGVSVVSVKELPSQVSTLAVGPDASPPAYIAAVPVNPVDPPVILAVLSSATSVHEEPFQVSTAAGVGVPLINIADVAVPALPPDCLAVFIAVLDAQVAVDA